MRMKTRLTSGLYGMVLAGLFFGMQQTASAALFLTNTTNIQLGKHQTEVGDNLSDNPNLVANAKVGSLVSFTASSSPVELNATFGLSNLSDGDIGLGVPSDGTYAIPDGNAGTLTLSLGSTQTLGSIAIYNGYANRDDGAYTIKDGAGNVLGAYSITTVAPPNTNDGVDSFWLNFKAPVTTDAIQIDFTTTDDTPSFREIQLFDSSVTANITKIESDPTPTLPFGDSFPTIPAPSGTDLGQTGILSIVGGTVHPNSNPSVNILNDGLAQDGPVDCCGATPNNPNGVTDSFFFTDTAPGKVRMDFAEAKNIAEVRAFSWFELTSQDNVRVGQLYDLYGSNAADPGNTDADLLDPAQWTLLGSINTDAQLGIGPRDYTQLASSVTSPTGSLGTYSHLLWHVRPLFANGLNGLSVSTFYSEFDVIEAASVIPEPATMSLLALAGAGMMMRRRRAA